MRILILNTWYYPNMKGGAEHSVKLLAEGLARVGNVVAVFTIDSTNKKVIYEVINQVHVYRGTGGAYDVVKAYNIKRGPILGLWKKCIELWNYSIIPELDWVYTNFHPDIVHANCISGISLSSISYFQKKKLPIVYTLRDFYLDNYKNVNDSLLPTNFFVYLFTKIYRTFTNCMTKNVDAAVAPSMCMLNYILQRGGFKNSRIKTVICNCVPIDIEKSKEYINEKSFHDKRNFIYAGSLAEVKGIKEMIDAFVSTSISGNLTICGDGPLAQYVIDKSNVDCRIIYKGKLSKYELENEYRQADVLIVPSLWAEPFGRVVIEGAKFGLLIIGSNRGGIPEIIHKLQCGFIWDTNEREQLYDLILKASYIDFNFDYMLKNLDFYSLDNQINNYMSIYKQLLF